MYVAGIDEAGRGPLAGPVVAAAVVLKPGTLIDGLGDSKKLSERKREELYPIVLDNCLAYEIVHCSAREIEEHNIRQATRIAMQRAAGGVERKLLGPCFFLIDGNMRLEEEFLSEDVVKGDQKLACISAASILAKVSRDRVMLKLDEIYPEYGFATHKGYPTKSHREMIRIHGPSLEHRRTFAGVREYL